MSEIRKLPYSIDFDGVLAEGVYPDPGIGQAINSSLEKLEEVTDAGHEIVIHTSRSWSDYDQLKRWLDIHCVPYNAIVCGKFLAAKYVDDKAIWSEEPTWL